MASSKETGLRRNHLNSKFFSKILAGINKTATLLNWTPYPLDVSSGHVSRALKSVQAKDNARILGHFAFNIKYTLPSKSVKSNDAVFEKVIVLKSKPRHSEILQFFMYGIPEMSKDDLKEWGQLEGIYNSSDEEHTELGCVKLDDACIKSILPDIYWASVDEEHDIFAFAMEYFQGPGYSNNPGDWENEDILAILEGFAVLHGRYYGCTDGLPTELSKYLNTTFMTMDYLKKMASPAKVLLNKAKVSLPHIVTNEVYQIALAILNNTEEIVNIIGKPPVTLIHRDCSLINLCLRKAPGPDKSRLCLYDWEMAGIGPPQYDLAMFLTHKCQDPAAIQFYINKYKLYLREQVSLNRKIQTGKFPDEEFEDERFDQVFDVCMMVIFLRGIAVETNLWKLFKHTEILTIFVMNSVKHIISVKEKYSFLQGISC